MAQATLNGFLADDGGEACSMWFEYGDTPVLTNTTPVSTGHVTGDTISETIYGLVPSSTYYFRVAASNSGGTSYGSVRSFTTLAPAPEPPLEATQSPFGVLIDDGVLAQLMEAR